MKITNSYIAGVADSDGSFTISKRVRKNHAPTYECKFSMQWRECSESKRFFKELKNRFGGSICRIHNGYSYMQCYVISNKGLDNFLKKVGPFIFLKRKQLEVIKNLRKSILKNRGNSSKPKTKKLIGKQESLYKKLRSLNKRNKKVGKSL